MSRKIYPSAQLAVPLAEVKVLLRLDQDDEDALLATFIRTATNMAEEHLRYALMRQNIDEIFSGKGLQHIDLSDDVKTVVSVEADGMPLLPEQYILDTGGGLHLSLLVPANIVSVRAIIGYAEHGNDIPEAIRAGIARLAAHLFSQRSCSDAVGVPASVIALWQPFRALGLGARCIGAPR